MAAVVITDYSRAICGENSLIDERKREGADGAWEEKRGQDGGRGNTMRERKRWVDRERREGEGRRTIGGEREKVSGRQGREKEREKREKERG